MIKNGILVFLAAATLMAAAPGAVACVSGAPEFTGQGTPGDHDADVRCGDDDPPDEMVCTWIWVCAITWCLDWNEYVDHPSGCIGTLD